jgi:hypothetical protein
VFFYCVFCMQEGKHQTTFLLACSLIALPIPPSCCPCPCCRSKVNQSTRIKIAVTTLPCHWSNNSQKIMFGLSVPRPPLSTPASASMSNAELHDQRRIHHDNNNHGTRHSHVSTAPVAYYFQPSSFLTG